MSGCRSGCSRSTRSSTSCSRLHQPDVVAVERLFFSRNVQTAFGVGQARGVVLLAAAQHGVPVREATPNEVKSAIAGYGAADKEQVQRMVQMVLGMAERPRPDDAADALAIAVWAANSASSGTRRVVGRHGSGSGRTDHHGAHPATSGPSARHSHARSGMPARTAAVGRVIASVEGVVGAIAADSLVIEVGGIGYRVFAAPAILPPRPPAATSSCTPTTSCARTSRRCTASARPRSSGSSTCC